MGIHHKQLVQYVIEPTLVDMGLFSDAAVSLLLGTAAVESGCGRYLHQIGGPALGIYQMEPATHDDIYRNFLPSRPDLRSLMRDWSTDCGVYPSPADQLVYDLRYATAMARLHYLRAPGAIPLSLDGQAAYYKQHYNTPLGKGSARAFIDAVRSL